MTNGTVKFFNAAKGFGFITPDDGGKDVFVPAASIASSGLTRLKPGQRVTFEAQPDGKGPKAVDLKLIEGAPLVPQKVAERKAPAPVESDGDRSALTVYFDPASDLASDALDELREGGHEPRLVDYIAAPPSKEELKALSLLLRDSDQSLVRKYDPLFLELRLDDRFISDGEYWAAIHEHPSLINGPVLATATRACVCRTEDSVKAFMAVLSGGVAPAAQKPKGLSPRLLELVGGTVAVTAAAPAPAPVKITEKISEKEPEKNEVKKIVLKPRTRPAAVEKVEAPATAKPVAKKVAAKKPAAPKPAKKAVSKKK
jgi:CspA family cold shock protein